MSAILFVISTLAAASAFVFAVNIGNVFGALLALSLTTLNLSQINK